MMELALLLMLAGATPAVGEPCTVTLAAEEYHLSEVCAELLEGSPACSATFRASLNPQPAAQQVLVYRMDGQWFVRTAGYRWVRSGAFSTRRHDIAIADADAKMIADRVSAATLERLAALPYYGSTNAICTDGASLELATATGGKRYSASQHTCAGVTEISGIAAAFGALAIKYDPEFAGMLDGITGQKSAAD